ncbi:MAG: hypothetical protein HYV02_00605 [Deltaproteobacteria bacterium]|nr:hypothetical protein [Deltaproteobacteria bacterium]
MSNQRGGKRPGAGRKPGIPNIVTQTLRDKIQAEKLLQELQALVFKNKGAPSTGEKINVIKFLLNKVIPDIQRVEIEEVKEENLDFSSNRLSDDHALKIAQAAIKTIEARRAIQVQQNPALKKNQ